MSRPQKQGLDYFPRDINIYDDEKIMDLLDRYGPSGFVVYDYALTRIYRNGYYLEIPSLDQFGLFAVRAVGSRWITKEHVGNVLTYCGKTGLFRVDLLNVGVLTSAGIQRRYKVATSRRVLQNLKYWVLDENGNELPEPLLSAPSKEVSAAETQVNAAETAVNVSRKYTKKRKEKEKETKEKPDPSAAAIFQLLGDCGFMVSSYIGERFLGLLDQYGEQPVSEAIRRAAEKNVKNVSYVEGILRRWEEKGETDASFKRDAISKEPSGLFRDDYI